MRMNEVKQTFKSFSSRRRKCLGTELVNPESTKLLVVLRLRRTRKSPSLRNKDSALARSISPWNQIFLSKPLATGNEQIFIYS